MEKSSGLPLRLNDNTKAFVEMLKTFFRKMYLLVVKSMDFLLGFTFFYLVLVPSFSLHELGKYLKNKKI